MVLRKSSLAVHCLGFGAFTVVACVQSLVEKLRSSQVTQCSQKKKKNFFKVLKSIKQTKKRVLILGRGP